MKCQKCNSNRLMGISAKSNDLNTIRNYAKSVTYEGYVPEDIGIDGGDSLEFDWCLNCGQIQGLWPIPVSDFEDCKDDYAQEDEEGYKNRAYSYDDEDYCLEVEKLHTIKAKPTDYFVNHEDKYICYMDGKIDHYIKLWLQSGEVVPADAKTCAMLVGTGDYDVDSSVPDNDKLWLIQGK